MQYEEMAFELERRILSTNVILRYVDECRHVSKGKCFQCATISSLTHNIRGTLERTAKALREINELHQTARLHKDGSPCKCFDVCTDERRASSGLNAQDNDNQ